MGEKLKKLSIRVNKEDHEKLKLVRDMENQTTISKIKTLIENYTYNQNRYKENKIQKQMINIKLPSIVPKELKKQLSQSNYCKNSKTISKVGRGLIDKYLLDDPVIVDFKDLQKKIMKFYRKNRYRRIDFNAKNNKNKKESIKRDASINFKLFNFKKDRLDKKVSRIPINLSLNRILEMLFYGYTFEEKITLEEKYFKRVCLTARINENLYQDFKEDRLVNGKLISIQQAGEALIKQELIKHNELKKIF
jgi:hypothetical protein